MARAHGQHGLAARPRRRRLRGGERSETPQEHWGNQSGWSPNTIATEIAALICAANIARRNGDAARARTYRETADAWQSKVEDWTATDSSEYYRPAPYYVRITKDGNPNDGSDYARRQLPAAR